MRHNTSNPSLLIVALLSKHLSTNASCKLHLPRTKTNQRNSRMVILARQQREIHPLRAITHLLQANHKQPKETNLFACRDSPLGEMKALTKETFLACCNQIWSGLGYQRATRHCFRIGGTTELLQGGTLVNLVKSMGCWKSDIFQRYWRGLGTIESQHVEFLQARKANPPHIAT